MCWLRATVRTSQSHFLHACSEDLVHSSYFYCCTCSTCCASLFLELFSVRKSRGIPEPHDVLLSSISVEQCSVLVMNCIAAIKCEAIKLKRLCNNIFNRCDKSQKVLEKVFTMRPDDCEFHQDQQQQAAVCIYRLSKICPLTV